MSNAVDFEKRKAIFWQNYQFALDQIDRDVAGLVKVLLIPELYNDKQNQYYDAELNRMLMEELNSMQKEEEPRRAIERSYRDLFEYYKSILLHMKQHNPAVFHQFKKRGHQVVERQELQFKQASHHEDLPHNRVSLTMIDDQPAGQ